jgi:hypothetical protein
MAAKGFAALGMVGLIALAANRQHRFLAVLVLLFFVVNLLHYLLARKFPYARAAGHFVPVVLLGAAYLAEYIIGAFESAFVRVLTFGAIALLSLGLAASSWALPLDDEPLAECLALAHQVEPAPGSRSYVVVRSGTDYIASLYGPRHWKRIDVVPPGIQLDVVLFSQDPDAGGEAMPGFRRIERYSLTRFSGETRPLAEEGILPPKAWVFWYPDFTLLGINAKDQVAYVRDSGYPALPQFTRYQVKFDVYSYLQCYLFIPREGTEPRKLAEVVREGLRRFGGRAVLFIPVETNVHSRVDVRGGK